MRLLYLCVVYLLAPLVGLAMLLRGFRDHSYWRNFGERFGFGAVPHAGSCIWVHAVSVGEVQASAALVRALHGHYPGMPLVVTTVTPTGAQRARALFTGLAHVRYVPYDLPGSVRRFFDRVRPRVAIILETELWPNLYHECGRRGVPLVLASARISPRSIGRYRRLAALFREALANGIVIAAQSPADAERFRFIGANPLRTHVMGNIKFDFALPEATVQRGAALRREHAPGRPVWVAGSTHAKEEDILLEAHRRVRERYPDALLVMVPRHPARFAEVRAALEVQQVSFAARSRGERCLPGTEVYLGDTLGELMLLYAAGDVAFGGGSLWRLAAWATGGMEVWLAAHFVGAPLPLLGAIAVEAIVQAARTLGFAIPAALGVQEGAFLLAGAALGLPAEAALAIALVKRGREIATGLPALFVWPFIERRAAAKAAGGSRPADGR